MPEVALSRAVARVAGSGPDGEFLPASTWQRLEALPAPRSARGRVCPLACLVVIAVCAFTAAGNDRLTAVGQWVRRASQEDLARLRAPWDPIAGRRRGARRPPPRFLGHSQLSQTQRYAHVTRELTVHAAECMGEALWG